MVFSLFLDKDFSRTSQNSNENWEEKKTGGIFPQKTVNRISLNFSHLYFFKNIFPTYYFFLPSLFFFFFFLLLLFRPNLITAIFIIIFFFYVLRKIFPLYHKCSIYKKQNKCSSTVLLSSFFKLSPKIFTKY